MMVWGGGGGGQGCYSGEGVHTKKWVYLMDIFLTNSYVIEPHPSIRKLANSASGVMLVENRVIWSKFWSRLFKERITLSSR